MFCRHCGKKGNKDAIACLGCGIPPLKGKKFCNTCGEATHELAIICVKCGTSLKTTSSSNINFKIGQTIGEPNPDPVDGGMAILWYLICYPIGYSQWGQATKGWVSLLLIFISFGFGGIILLVDYIMCYNAQKTRKLGEWEFFPST